MIVPMKKISLVVLEKEKREAAKKLRRLGAVHLETLHGGGEELTALRDACTKTENAASVLAEYQSEKDAAPDRNLNTAQIAAKTDEIIACAERKKQCREQVAQNQAELERFAKWGAFDPAALDALAEKGVYLSLYEISAAAYRTLPESLDTIFVSGDKSQARFLLVRVGSRVRPDELPPEACAVPNPRLSTKALEAEIAALNTEIGRIDKRLQGEATYTQAFGWHRKQLLGDIEFENVCSGMNAETAGSETLAWLIGYVPQSDAEALCSEAKQEGWALSLGEPAEDDPVPTKLKNNRLVSLIYPLTDFLETVPGYREYDISGWFLLFFCIFFGMLFGDAGYGLFLSLIAAGGITRYSLKGKAAPAVLKLLLLLGISNTAWGAATCSWFGVDASKLPALLQSISVPLISNATAARSHELEEAVSQNLQVVCFSLALLHLSVAHIKGIIRCVTAHSLKALSELGSIAMLAGMYCVVLSVVVSSARFPLLSGGYLKIVLCLIAGGFIFNFAFANYEGNIAKSIIASLQNIISVILGLANVFSDIMSYIRLWAVGLAGASISSTVNAMAGPLLGNFLIFLGIIVLVFGHGINIILNVLSVLVHGVRLNTLEFSSHLGVSWSGIAYKPFSETAIKQ